MNIEMHGYGTTQSDSCNLVELQETDAADVSTIGSVDDSQVEVDDVSTPKHRLPEFLLSFSPKVRSKWRTIVAAYVFAFCGTGMIMTGVITAFTGIVSTGVVVAVIGLTLFIPGVYYVFFICCALKERPGFPWQEVPDF